MHRRPCTLPQFIVRGNAKAAEAAANDAERASVGEDAP